MRGRALAGPSLLVAALLGACRFERRPDAPVAESAAALQAAAADSAGAAMRALTEALATRDVDRVRAATTPDALLIDQDEGVRWSPERAAEVRPPSPLAPGLEGLGWEMVDSSYAALAPNAALFSLRYRAPRSLDPVPRVANESWVVVRTETGWRVRYLHRSRGLDQTVTPQ